MKATDLVYTKPTLPEHLKAGFEKIQVMSREESIALWGTLTGMQLEILRQKAQLVHHFKKEGWDVHALSNGHTKYYLRIAYGQMDPRLFVALANADPAVLDRACMLTIDDQERFVADEKVPVLLSFNDKGEPYIQEMNLQRLALKHARTLLAGNKINTEAEQIANLRAKMKPDPKIQVGRLIADPKRMRAIFQVENFKRYFPLAELEAMVSEIRAGK